MKDFTPTDFRMKVNRYGLVLFFLLINFVFLHAQTNCNINHSTTSNSITVNYTNPGHTIIKLFNPNWSINTQCLDNCANPLTISGLTSGATYHLSYNLYDANWVPICNDLIDVVIIETSCTDNDGDGICEADDCDDNNPNIPTTPNTTCNDNNPNTSNDVIQSDGCTCVGTPVNNDCATYSTTSNSITISNLNNPHVILKVFNPNWTINYQCVDNCSNPTTVSGLASGTYHIAVNQYDASWSQVCSLTENVTISGGSTNQPDLDLADLQTPNTSTVGTVVNFTFDLKNIGTTTAAGSYVIRSYLSQDPTLDASDIEVGIVPTGNTPVGTINNVPGAITIPANLAAGNYYLIVNADDDDEIAESNENNNAISKVITVEGNTPGDECAFFKTYGPYQNSSDILTNCSAAENGGQFIINCTSKTIFTTTPRTRRRVVLTLDANGDPLSTTDEYEDIPTVTPFNPFTTEVENSEIVFTRQDANENIIFSTGVVPNLDAGLTLFDVAIESIFTVSDGFLAVGTVVSKDASDEFVFQYYSFKLDANGNFVNQNIYDTATIPDFANISGPLYTDNSGYVFDLFETNASRLAFIKFDINGNFLWRTNYTADLPSNSRGKIEVSQDGQYIYVVNRNNQRAFIDKVRLSDGFKVYKLALGSVLSPNGQFTLNEDIKSFILTPDGGVVVGYNYQIPGSSEGGYEYGKIDANGNLVWAHNLDIRYGLVPQIMTADGGFLFVNPNGENNVIAILKTTSTGERIPVCQGNNPGVGTALPCDLSYTLENGTMTISGEGLNAGHIIVKLFSPSWQTHFDCIDNCENPIVINGIGSGTYHLSVKLYNSNWQPSCEFLEDIHDPNRSAIEPVAIVLDQSRGIVLKQVFPIPASKFINIEISAKVASEFSAQLYDGQGRIVAQKPIELLEGTNRVKWDISELPSGFYQVLFNTGNRHTPIRFIKQRL